MSWLRLIFTSDHFIHPYETYKKCLRHWYAVLRAYGCTLIPLHRPSCPQIWGFRFFLGVKMMPQRHGWGWYSPQTTSYIHIRHIKVFETLVCCLKGIWLHPYTITPAKLTPDLGFQVHLRSENDATTSCLRLISTSDCFIHPYWTYTKCLSYFYAVSRAYGCTLIPLHRPSWPQNWEVRFTWGVEMMP